MADVIEKTPKVVKIWLGGFVPIYGAAKVHTWMTWQSGQYLERHWPFWAAMAGWTVLVFLIDMVADRLMAHSSPTEARRDTPRT